MFDVINFTKVKVIVMITGEIKNRIDMVRLEDIDIFFDVRSDNTGRDPDSSSPTLRAYHQALWSKPLPNGQVLCLTTNKDSYLKWNDMVFGSDSITASFRYERTKVLLEQVKQVVPSYTDFFENYDRKTYTIGGTIIFPKHHDSINQKRGCRSKIRDRWDLTLECIRRFYIREDSPLYDIFQKDKSFFDLFVNFKGYVDFFFLQDCVDEDYRVKLWLDTPLFESNPFPKNVDEYLGWIDSQLDFVKKRAERIADYCKSNSN